MFNTPRSSGAGVQCLHERSVGITAGRGVQHREEHLLEAVGPRATWVQVCSEAGSYHSRIVAEHAAALGT